MDINNIELKYFFKFFIIILIFFFVFELNYYRHWSSIQDQDLTLIHNSLLLNSGFKAEYHDHPGHTKILFLSLWINFLDLISFINISSYDSLKVSKNIKNDFIELVTYSRFLNVIVGSLFIYVFYNINKTITINKNSSYLLSILLITSFSFVNSISHIRTELLSATFIMFSFLYLIKLVSKNFLKRKYIFFFGFFLILSIFSKFQSIFVFLFFPIFLSLIQNKKIQMEYIFFEQRKIHIFLSIILFIFIFLIWFKYAKGLNLIFLPIFLLYLYLFLKYLDKKFFNNSKIFFIFLFYFFLGISFSFIFLYVFKPFHTNNISMVVNFFGASSMFVQGSNPYSSNLFEVLKLLNIAFDSFFNYFRITFITYPYNEIIFILISLITFNYNYKNNRKYLKNISMVYLFLIIIIFLFSVRPSKNYLIYFVPFIYIFFNYSIMNIKYKFFINSLIILLIFINFTARLTFIKDNKFLNQEDIVCNEETLSNRNFFYDKMRIEILPFACKED